jgi:hypothetical protein
LSTPTQYFRIAFVMLLVAARSYGGEAQRPICANISRVTDMKEHFVIDPLISKRQQLLLATQLCRMVLKVCYQYVIYTPFHSVFFPWLSTFPIFLHPILSAFPCRSFALLPITLFGGGESGREVHEYARSQLHRVDDAPGASGPEMRDRRAAYHFSFVTPIPRLASCPHSYCALPCIALSSVHFCVLDCCVCMANDGTSGQQCDYRW